MRRSVHGEERLPLGWTRAPIGALCTLINGKAFKPSDWGPDGLPIVRIQNLNDPERPFNHSNADVEDRYRIDTGELLFAWSGTPGTSFGAHIWTRGPALLNQHIFRVIPKPGVVDKEFLRLAINERLAHLVAIAHGGAGLAHVTKPVFEQTKVVLPPAGEQRRIVAWVNTTSARSRSARSALNAVPQLVERLRQSILAAAFRGDLTADWRAGHPDVEPASELLKRIRTKRRRRWEEAELARLVAKGKAPIDDRWKARYDEPEPVDDSVLPGLPAGWCWASVEELCVMPLRTGLSVRGSDTPPGLRSLRLDALAGDLVDFSCVRYVPLQPADVGDVLVEQGDFLVSRGNGSLSLLARGAYVAETPDPPVLFPDTAFRLRLHREVGAWLRLIWASPPIRSRIEAAAKTTAGIYKVSQTAVAGFPVPLPPLDEQVSAVRRGVGHLDRLGQTRRAQELARDQLTILEAAVLAAAFSGGLGGGEHVRGGDPAPRANEV